MSRGKFIFITTSLMVMALSVWVYLSQTQNRSQGLANGDAPKARMSGYEIYKYKGEEVIARASGKSAAFVDAGKLLCDGGTRMIRIKKGQREEVSANEAIITFPPDTKIASQTASAETIELHGEVEMLRSDTKFTTEWLTYSDKTKEAFTERPVRLEHAGQFIAAEQGMTYNMQTESIRMRGGIFGSVKSSVMDNVGKNPK
jgi:lipopolysaccharide export system protein LptC